MRPVVTRNGKALAIAPDIQVTLRQAEFQPEPAVRSALADDWRVRNDPESLIDELGEIVDAAALDPEHWEHVFRRMQDFVPNSRIVFQAHDQALPTPLPMLTLGWDDSAIDAYLKHYAAINPWIPSWQQIPVAKAVPSNLFIEDRLLSRTEFYNDWLKPIGQAEFATGMKLAQERGRLAQFAIHYDPKLADTLHQPLSVIFDALAPRLRRAFDCNRITARPFGSIKGSPLLETMIDPAFLVNATCKLIDTNDAARNLLERRYPFRVGAQDALVGIGPNVNARLREIVGRACARVTGSLGSSEFVIPGADRRLAVQALPIAPNLKSLMFRGAATFYSPAILALVVVRELTSAPSDVGTALQSRFRLTASEVRLALALSGGGSMVEIADRLGLQYETARSHLKAAFAKTKTHNQRELLALIVELGNAGS